MKADKLTKKQRKELVVWEYFVPKDDVYDEPSDGEIVCFFEWSERGKHKDTIGKYGGHSYADKLFWGKTWAGRHAEMYEDGLLSGDTCYMDILGLWDFDFNPVPREVAEFLSKEMFNGMDREMIMNLYDAHTQR